MQLEKKRDNKQPTQIEKEEEKKRQKDELNGGRKNKRLGQRGRQE